MMTPGIRQEGWTDAQLEAYHDGELAGDELAALTGALRTDPALRERLASIARHDTIVRAAIASKEAPRTTTNVAPAWRFRAGLALAAILALVVAAALVMQRTQPAQPRNSDMHPVPVETASAPTERRDDGVVLSLVLHRQPAGARERETANDAPTPSVSTFDQNLARALDAGDVDAALALLADASPAQRALATQRLGRIVRTGQLAERILKSLPLEDQLQLCEAWAEQPHLRYASFTRLSELAGNPATRDDVAVTIEQLRARPGMTGWLRSYGLVDPTT